MRDILVILIVFGSLPFIFKRPYIGILMWVWISVMNPHTQGWGFALTFPFAAIIAGVTMVSFVFTKDSRNLPNMPIVWILAAFVLWMNITTLSALLPDLTYLQWNKVMKIMLMIFITMMLIKTQRQIHLLIVILVISLGYYGVKGGIFTIKSGGVDMVWGPEGTFIGGNNEIALALIMTIPLMHYLQLCTHKKWVRHGLTASMLLCALAALGSYSRGALLAIAAMGVFLWLKSDKKVNLGILLVIAIPILVMFMPDKWGDRMDTINTYQEDSSVQGRFNAWRMAYNLALDRPMVGGGFEIYEPQIFNRYAPNPTDVHAAHSIYFQALGEHGFIGLGLFLLLGFQVWRMGTWIIRNTAGHDEYKWATSLATMIQVSLVGYAVGGAFLSLLYFDLPYYLMAAMLATRVLVEKDIQEKAALSTPGKRADARRFLTPSAPKQPRPVTRNPG